ncbi:MAG: formate hydrogenlyase [Actinobacteria bacterium]|nr:MAG: formate hydrogenlyase [Actinomycetota bacterium]
MSSVAAGALQVTGVALAPLLPGAIQSAKARLQGRRGASPLQPYRVLGRLWRKSTVDPEGTGIVYRAAPALAGACLLLAIALVPLGGRSGDWSLGNDALVLVGLLALARFAVTAAAWDTSNGFALMGAARDLTLAVFGEALLLLALLVAALPARSTDLVAMTGAAAGTGIWGEPAHWCGALAFALVVLVETGRQPVDNPDTHLELTMIHEGPLLEYAGRDLAYLHWVAAARHWVILTLAAQLFLPHPLGFAGGVATLAGGLVALCAALAVTETFQAKMRILRVPSLLTIGSLVALVGVGSWVAGGGS